MLLALVLSNCGPVNTETVEAFPTQAETKVLGPESISSPTLTEQVSMRDIDVPLGPAPTVDGTLSEGEWQGAYEERMLGGGELNFLHDGTYLYIGIDAGARGMGSLCVSRGDRVEVLHSSAALGGRYYQRAAEYWSLVEETDWCCRGGRTGEAAEAE